MNKTLLCLLTAALISTTAGSQTIPITRDASGTVRYVGGRMERGEDIGAQVNEAYASLPPSGGTIIVVADAEGRCYNFSTPIVAAVPGKYILLEAGNSHSQIVAPISPACLNYVPTTASAAITLDYVARGQTMGSVLHGIRNLMIVNNHCETAGGCGSNATGIAVGSLNGSTEGAIFASLQVLGFGTGVGVTNGSSTTGELSFRSCTFSYNETGFTDTNQQSPQISFDNCRFQGNGTAVASSASLQISNSSFDSNTVLGIACASPAACDLSDNHFENSNSDTTHFLAGTGMFSVLGGDMRDDKTTGTTDWWMNFAGSSFFVLGTIFTSAGRTASNVICNGSPGVALVQNTTPGTLPHLYSNAALLAMNSSNGATGIQNGLDFPTIAANSGAQPNSMIEGTIVVDGTQYTTIEAALAAVPRDGGTVIVPAGRVATWNGGRIPANTMLRFEPGAASYRIAAPVTLGPLAHIVCGTGQSTGLSGQSAGITLDFTGNLGPGQDAISASGNNNNDGVTVEGCYLQMGGSGRAGIHVSGVNGARILNNVVADPGTNGIWIDGGSSPGSHAYENRIQGNDVIHGGGDGYLISVDPAGTGVGGDVDGTILDQNEYHPRDIGGRSSTGHGCRLLVPSTASHLQTIGDTIFTKFLSNGSRNGTYACKLEVNVATPKQAYIINTQFLEGELEDVNQINRGTALLFSSTNQIAIQNFSFDGSYGAGFRFGTNANATGQNVSNITLQNGNATPTNASASISQRVQDVLFFTNSYSNSNGWCMPGLGWSSGNGGSYKDALASDGIRHFYRFDGATSCTGGGNFVEWMQWDQENKHIRLLSTTDLSVGTGTPVTSTGAGGTMESVVASGTVTITAGNAVGCLDQTASAKGATPAMKVIVSASSPQPNIVWSGYVSAENMVDIRVCTIVATIGSAVSYNWSVLP